MTGPARRGSDETIETAIYAAAAKFPMVRSIFPSVSTFIPCFMSTLYYLNYMDFLMASTKRWTDDCMGWVPPYSQIYISVLLYIQVMRATEAAGALSPFSKISSFLKDFCLIYPLESLWVPGLLVSCFKNLACFSPDAAGRFGNVTPCLPSSPGWSRENGYKFYNAYATHLPNISIFISRLRSVCAAAIRPNTTETVFQNDADGPRFLATLFEHACDHGANELVNMASPGANLAYAGSLNLWQDAASQLDSMNMPDNLDASETDVNDSWIGALRFDTVSSWFGPLAAMMARYCRFWRGSCSLAECLPSGSAAGSVRCVATETSNIFAAPAWTEQADNQDDTQHSNQNQVGYYSLRHGMSLTFHAATSIGDIPDAHVLAALTYHYYLARDAAGEAILRKGPFWNIAPDAFHQSGVQVYQGVFSLIAREYHKDRPG